MLIDVISDTICPWCFIGKRRLERALAERPELDAQVTWRPFQLNPDMPAGGLDRETYLTVKFGGKERAQRIYSAIREAGREDGIDFAFEAIARVPNTVDSHRLIHWSGAAGRQDAAVELLFRRYFLEGVDIGDREVLAQVAAEAGMDSKIVQARLADGDDIDVVKVQDSHGRKQGITGVPFFIIGRKYSVSGAQAPNVFLQIFDLLARSGTGAEAEAAGA